MYSSIKGKFSSYLLELIEESENLINNNAPSVDIMETKMNKNEYYIFDKTCTTYITHLVYTNGPASAKGNIA